MTQLVWSERVLCSHVQGTAHADADLKTAEEIPALLRSPRFFLITTIIPTQPSHMLVQEQEYTILWIMKRTAVLEVPLCMKAATLLCTLWKNLMLAPMLGCVDAIWQGKLGSRVREHVEIAELQ